MRIGKGFERKKRIASREVALQSLSCLRQIFGRNSRINTVDKQGEGVMRTMVVRVASFLLLGVVMLGATAHAQRNEQTIKVNIPFNFSVGSRAFPAGSYSLVRRDPSLLELRNATGQLLTNLLTQSVRASTGPVRSKLRFDSLGDRRILIDVWQEGDSVGQEILQSQAEIRMVRRRSEQVDTAKAGDLQ
jgi:hypothetical protein